MTRSACLFLAWTAFGFTGSFLVLYGFTVFGLAILLALWLAHRFLPAVGGGRMPEALGVFGGFGAFLVFTASTVDGDASAVTLAGLLLLGASVAAYLLIGRRRCRGSLAVG